MHLVATKRFDKELKTLLSKNHNLAIKIDKTLSLIKDDLSRPSLRLHKMTGTHNFSVSVNMSIRILIHKDQDFIYLLRIGTHEEVY